MDEYNKILGEVSHLHGVLPENVINQVIIDKLKNLLNQTDYKAMPDYDMPNSDIFASRQFWRSKIRELSDTGSIGDTYNKETASFIKLKGD